ncbi:MAG: ABC transporter ATP-binding protein [Oscillospiraceae bacterium]
MNKVLEVKNLVKQYNHSPVRAVDGINFDVERGELFCLLGINGAGKSTTINIICTLLTKTSGDIILDGKTLGVDDDEIRKSIGIVFQDNSLDKVLTVEENILSRGKFYGLTKEEAKNRLNVLSENLSMSSFLKSRYGRLSGGQRRKCDIARALLAKPKILFLDEPTTGLDPQSRMDLWETIEDIRKKENMTVFLTTHYMEETENADRVAIVNKGKVLCINTPQKLKTIYSPDLLRLVVKEGLNNELEKHLTKYKLVSDTYTIEFKNGIESIDLLTKVKPYLDSFELEKGKMDHVFLNVVGGKV